MQSNRRKHWFRLSSAKPALRERTNHASKNFASQGTPPKFSIERTINKLKLLHANRRKTLFRSAFAKHAVRERKNPNWFSSAAHATLSKESTESIVSEVPITLKTQF